MTQISYKEVTKLASLVRALQGLVDRLASGQIQLTPEQRERIEKFRGEGRCLVCENLIVPGEEVRRGSHQACHNRVANEIKMGKRTEREAVEAGEWNPYPDAPGRKPRHSKEKKVQQAVEALTDAARRDKVRDKKPKKPVKGG